MTISTLRHNLIVRRWAYIRIPVLILSIWGLIYMLGFLFGMLTRPHAIGPAGIRARYGPEIGIPLSWDDIDSVTRRRATVQNKQPRVTVDENGRATLYLRMQNQTNIEVRLRRPIKIRLPQGPETVSEVNLYADEPQAFMNEVRRHAGGR
jgi:hypothetical protein